jgi:predicted metal-dependent hydrolase
MAGAQTSYPHRVQLDLPFLRASEPEPAPQPDVHFVRVKRARKYILRVRPDGSLRVTIPRGGSRREAEAFVQRHQAWVAAERLRAAERHAPVQWRVGDTIPLRGEPSVLRVQEVGRSRMLVVGDQRVRLTAGADNVRPAAELALRRIAYRELAPRREALAAEHRLTVSRITIRNQRSRWGSCSHRGVIALNFRLVQMPPWVCDYVLLHELMHLRQQNHSRRYWRLVAEVFPEYRAAERWLKLEGKALF